MNMDLAPEFRLFCLAVRSPQRIEHAAALRDAIEAAPNWACVIDGAQRHLLAAQLLAGLRTCGSAQLPGAAIAELRRQTLAATRRSLAQIAEIGKLLRAFAAAGVRVLALKGVVLSTQLYGDASARGAHDIDLLVDPDRMVQADAVLLEAGYRRAVGALSARQSATYQRWIKEFQYIHAATGGSVELHHRLCDNPYLLAWDFDTLWDERDQVRVGDTVIPTLPAKRLSLYLCVHSAGHAWERLRWLVDLAALLREPGRVDAAIETAEAAGLAPAMLHAMIMAHDWLDLPVDDRHLVRARAQAQVRRLDRIAAHLYAGPAWHEMPRRDSWPGLLRYSLWARLYRLSLKPDWRYRADQARREWFTPADWNTVRLPDALFWLYPLLRPMGWLVRRWRRSSR
jgi:Uncharacterised nucleotidyltransferase